MLGWTGLAGLGAPAGAPPGLGAPPWEPPGLGAPRAGSPPGRQVNSWPGASASGAVQHGGCPRRRAWRATGPPRPHPVCSARHEWVRNKVLHPLLKVVGRNIGEQYGVGLQKVQSAVLAALALAWLPPGPAPPGAAAAAAAGTALFGA